MVDFFAPIIACMAVDFTRMVDIHVEHTPRREKNWNLAPMNSPTPQGLRKYRTKHIVKHHKRYSNDNKPNQILRKHPTVELGWVRLGCGLLRN